MFKKILLSLFFVVFFNPTVFAEDDVTEEAEVGNDYHYFLLEPDIITNYSSSGKRIGYIRATIELLVDSKSDLTLLENNEPLIRDKIIEILGKQKEEVVKSTGQRENIRTQCVGAVNAVLASETGQKPVKELIFTKFLYQ